MPPASTSYPSNPLAIKGFYFAHFHTNYSAFFKHYTFYTHSKK